MSGVLRTRSRHSAMTTSARFGPKSCPSHGSDAGFADEIDKHHQGGAAGYRTREWVIHPNSTDVVESDQAFAWNPSITGTKVEETVIASGGQCEVITASPGFPQIVTTIDRVEYRSPGILEI